MRLIRSIDLRCTCLSKLKGIANTAAPVYRHLRLVAPSLALPYRNTVVFKHSENRYDIARVSAVMMRRFPADVQTHHVVQGIQVGLSFRARLGRFRYFNTMHALVNVWTLEPDWRARRHRLYNLLLIPVYPSILQSSIRPRIRG